MIHAGHKRQAQAEEIGMDRYRHGRRPDGPRRARCDALLDPGRKLRAYINFLTQEETDRIAFAYGATYNRLVAPKKKYDPTNLFRMNQNIKPV